MYRVWRACVLRLFLVLEHEHDDDTQSAADIIRDIAHDMQIEVELEIISLKNGAKFHPVYHASLSSKSPSTPMARAGSFVFDPLAREMTLRSAESAALLRRLDGVQERTLDSFITGALDSAVSVCDVHDSVINR